MTVSMIEGGPFTVLLRLAQPVDKVGHRLASIPAFSITSAGCTRFVVIIVRSLCAILQLIVRRLSVILPS